MRALIVLLMREDRVTIPAATSDLACPGPGRGLGDVSQGAELGGEIMARAGTGGAASLRG